MKTTYMNFAKRFAMIMAVAMMAVNVWGATLIIDGEELSSTQITTAYDYTYTADNSSDYTITMNYVKYQPLGSGYSNNLSDGKTILGAYGNAFIYNKTALGSQITGFKVYSNKGASTSGGISVCFSSEALTSNCASPAYDATLGTADYVYDLTEYLSDGDKYFYLKVTNPSDKNKNVQIQIEVTFSTGYAVTYNAGGHGTAPSGTTAASVTLPNMQNVTGYTFQGWKADKNVTNTSTSANITAGNLITAGTGVTLSQETTFTAQWEINKYTVSVVSNNGDYGTVDVASVANVPYGTVPTCSDNTVTVNGTTITATPHAQDVDYNYSFSSWSDIPASVTGNVTITANFNRSDRSYTNYRTACAETYTVDYDANGGSGSVPTDATEYDTDAEVTVADADGLSKNHYAFAGWNTKEDGSGTLYDAGDKFNITKNTTLYAQWTCAEKVTVSAGTPEHGSFELSQTDAIATCDDEVVITVTPTPDTGYHFSAITQSGTAVGTINQGAKTVTFAQYASGTSEINVTFDANVSTITWNLNYEGAPASSSDNYTYDGAAVELPNPARDNYTFLGWFTAANGGTEITEIGGTNKPVANVEYFAHWELKKYTITWMVGTTPLSGAVALGSASVLVSHGGIISELPPTPTIALGDCAETFRGWSLEELGNEDGQNAPNDMFTTASGASSITITQNTTFHAVFATQTAAPSTALVKMTAGQTLANGDEVVIVANGTEYALYQETDGTSWVKNWEFTGTDPVMSDLDDAKKSWKVTASNGKWKFGDATNGYLHKGNSTDLSVDNTESEWSFTDNEDGTFYLTCSQKLSCRTDLTSDNANKWRGGGSGAGSGAQKLLIYKKVSTPAVYENHYTKCVAITCGVPSGANATPTGNGATLSWTASEVGTPDHYEYAVWADGDAEPTDNYSTTNTNSASVSGLMSSTTYNWKVRAVCGENDESKWLKNLSFTTTAVDLTFNVPEGVSAVAAQTSATALPSAGVPASCGDCWAFVGWSENANCATAPEYAAGETYKFDGDKTLHAVYSKAEYKMVYETSELVNNDNYILASSTEWALGNAKHSYYSTDAVSVDISGLAKQKGDNYYIYNPTNNIIWRFTGNASSGQLYNAAADKFVNLDADNILGTTQNLVFTISADGETWVIKSATPKYLHGYTDSHGNGFESVSSSSWDEDDYSGLIYRQISAEYATAPDCSGKTIKWYVIDTETPAHIDNNVSTCTGIESLPTVDVEDVRCKTEGTVFMGWSETNIGYTPISDADAIAALNLFKEVEDAPAITGDKSFYAVFAEKGGSVQSKYQDITISNFTEITTNYTTVYTHTYAFPALNANTQNVRIEAYGVYNSSNGIQMNSGKDTYIKNLDALPGAITKIEMTWTATGKNSPTIYVAKNAVASTSSTNLGKQSSSATTHTINLNAEDGYKYFYFDGTTVTGACYMSLLKITYQVGEYTYSDYFTECCPQHAITLSGVDNTVGKHFEADLEAACADDVVTLTKTENGYYNWTGFTVKDENNQSVDVAYNMVTGESTFTMPATAVTVTATWTAKNYFATVNEPDPAVGSVTVTGGTIVNDERQVAYGGELTVEATAADNDHYFIGWTIEPAIAGYGSQNPMTITMPGNNVVITANFGEVAYSALTLGSSSLSATLENGDEILDMGSIRAGTTIKVTYTPDGQKELTGWTYSTSVIPSENGNTVTFNMPGEALTVGITEVNYYILSLSAENGSISGVSINTEAQELAAEYRVYEADVVALTAAPENDTYKFDSWECTGATITNGSLTVGTSDISVTAKFVNKSTYDVTLIAMGKTHEVIEAQLEGESIWSIISSKTAPVLTDYTFMGWSTDENDANAIIDENSSDVLGAATTLYALYSLKPMYYTKVTRTEDITNGQYLIVYEGGEVAFNGGLESAHIDDASNTIDVEIIGGNRIEISNTTTAAEFTIDATAGTLRSASGLYIERTSGSSGGSIVTKTDEPATHTFTISEGNFLDKVQPSTTQYYLKYNSNNDQKRFRYYIGATSQTDIQLYKREVAGAGEANPVRTVVDGETMTINANKTYADLVIKNGGEVTVADNMTLTVNNFTIESTMGSGKSGQVTGDGTLNVTGDAYIDITLGVYLTQDYNTPEGQVTGAYKAANQWHAFTVPFPVDVLNGIYDLDGNKLANEVDYAIMDYHGDIRANGEYGWKKYRSVMVPGTFYIMTVNGDIQTFRMKKTADGALVAGNTKDLYEYASTTGNNDNGWNGVGNPTLVYGTVDQIVQVLNPSTYTYEQFLVGAKNFVVGTPFFVQAGADGTMTMGAVDGEKPYYAPVREATSEIKDIEVTFGNEQYSDRLYISASEDALNQYETGKDLVKMTMTNTPSVAQIFGKAYNSKLCMVYAPMSNNQAVYDLTLYAPQAGEYTIAVPSMDNADLYLTYEGTIIWNLSMGEYVADFAKGNNEGYGIVLQAKAPNSATGIEDSVFSDQSSAVQKVIIDEHVYILRGGEMYDVTGKAIK